MSESTNANQPQSPAPDAPGASAAVKERPAPPRQDQLPPYRVLLHNDDVNAIDDVVFSVVELARLPLPAAVQVTMTAHQQGLALLCVTHKEKAELLEEQFRSRKLTVTIEPAI